MSNTKPSLRIHLLHSRVGSVQWSGLDVSPDNSVISHVNQPKGTRRQRQKHILGKRVYETSRSTSYPRHYALLLIKSEYSLFGKDCLVHREPERPQYYQADSRLRTNLLYTMPKPQTAHATEHATTPTAVASAQRSQILRTRGRIGRNADRDDIALF